MNCGASHPAKELRDHSWHLPLAGKRFGSNCHNKNARTKRAILLWRLPESNWGHTDFQNVKYQFRNYIKNNPLYCYYLT